MDLGKPRREGEAPWPEDIPQEHPEPVEEPAWPQTEPAVPAST